MKQIFTRNAGRRNFNTPIWMKADFCKERKLSDELWRVEIKGCASTYVLSENEGQDGGSQLC